MCNRILLVVAAFLFAGGLARAQSLAPLHESKSMGIAIRPPTGCKLVKTADPEELLLFVDEGRKWSVRITRTMLEKPMPLSAKEALEDPANKLDEPAKNYMEYLVEQFLATSGDAQVLRQEDMVIGRRRLGLLAIRHTLTGQHRLRQQAVLQQTRKVYYSIEMSSPGAKPNSSLEEDAQEKEAHDVFNQMLNTVQLLDQTAIRDDQDQRLFRTRSLFMSLNEASVGRVLVPETYLRHIRDGKDIGYSYRVEEPFESAGQQGFHIGIRSRIAIDDGKQIDSERWCFSTWDRRHEDFSTIAITGDEKDKTSISELGVSNRETERMLDADAKNRNVKGDANDPNQPRVLAIDKPTLSVSLISKTERRPPIEVKPPVWYIPMALNEILPRVLPLEQRTYLVAVWSSERQKVLLQYVDVGREEMTMLGELAIRGFPVRTKIGLEGSVTTTYVSRDGKFLGRINEEEKTMTLPSTEQELLGIWKNADLTRPKVVAR